VSSLAAQVARELAVAVPPAVTAFAQQLAAGQPGAVAVLYYGSTLRTQDLSGLLDFYVLTGGPHRRGLRGVLESRLWPEVSYREAQVAEDTLRAKVATMPLATFAEAAAGRKLDTTIWARFVQPTALVWSRDPQAAQALVAAVGSAASTAAAFAAALGPAQGPAAAFWGALFRQTYQAEFRVETGTRADEILRASPERWAALLPLAWEDAEIRFTRSGEALAPALEATARKILASRWRTRRAAGKPLNLARIAKAAFTFDGAARYAAWKIQRHTGLVIEVTPFRERHPLLASPVVLWKLWRWKRG
jgi:hypothetical protein